jgi:hypothetical protein
MSQREPSSDVRAERAVPRVPVPELTPGQTRIEYAHYARLAELHAYCHAQALAGRRYTAALGSERNYRQAARKCRVLGELMRGSASSPQRINGNERNQMDPPMAELAQRATQRQVVWT